MEIIEFLQTTQHKNLNNFIGFKVKQKLQEYEVELEGRRQKLRNILEFENCQLNEELLMLVTQRVKTAAQQRLEWINTKRMEQHKAQEELLRVKKLQRDLENCEEWRIRQTQQLLVATKEAQLYQIEEKKQRRAREKLIEQNWLAAMEFVRQEREFQQSYEDKLRKVIEGTNQERNLCMQDAKVIKEQTEYEKLKAFHHEDNRRALTLDQKYKTDEKLRDVYKKLQQKQWLKFQIADNQQRNNSSDQNSLRESIIFKDREDYQIYTELDGSQRHKVRNNEWHKLYLEHCAREKQQRKEADLQHEQMYLNTGCVLQQRPKNPYGKNSR
ncbi:trichohyalin isoform X1 [Stomoxys calcitrans]|uniref:trichohyalin isoform X1 n=2 Tax=Stomoxys calcitrans TaxID=35570 RepID=UPI0027E31B55|nr:trichohyalin isoform X1 [Stomoxys calcitrans]